ncbi:hypothetical protein Glove_220g18 [Diversispora epigaea]|uniref:Protein kinase domain-containing protein n=1 Tax=Diversispora epigaea TaxID=1348612 RepID=A0A397IFA9_9GLOM|nr:hypothetical protein Glove_220g18 [Diversispora epigaea]
MATQEIKWNAKFRGVWDKGYYSLNKNIHRTITEQEKYRKNIVENNSSLTENEKKFLLYELQKAIQYCEFCIRKYLENNFGNWTSRNNEIDKLIQEFQQTTVKPHSVIEWINHGRFENANIGKIWKINDCFENSNNNNVCWFQEVSTLSFKLDNIGRTKHSRLYIINKIAYSLNKIHEQNIIHRNLHSGNILYYTPFNSWFINVYSLGIIMRKAITGETLFRNHRFDSDFVLAIINGYRPKIYKYIPQKYATLMKQCWDANPDNRPNTDTIYFKMYSLIQSSYNEMDKQLLNLIALNQFFPNLI